MWANDWKVAARRLRQQPGFTAVAVVTLALGLGVNTAIFTIASALTNQKLPVREPSQLFRLGDTNKYCCVNRGLQDSYSIFSYPLVQHLRRAAQEFGPLTAFQAGLQPVGIRQTGSSITESVPAQYVLSNYFEVLGAGPALGRVLEASDDAPGAHPVFVMSHRMWTSRYGADPAAVGSTFLVSGKPMTLAGVAAPGFYGETVRPDPAGVWLPMGQEPALRGTASLIEHADQDWLYAIGRLAPGATREQIAARVTPALQQWLSAQSFVGAGVRVQIVRQQIAVVPAAGGVQTLTAAFGQPVRLLSLMSALVLLIAAANLANLLLARADRGQAAVRVALGASPSRLVRQSMTEGLLLAIAGGGLGVLVAIVATRAIVALAFPGVGFLPLNLNPGPGVLLFALALALVTAVVFSIAPAWAMSRTDPMDALRGAGRGGQARSFMPRRVLVVAQVALSMLLLVGAGLLTMSLRQLERQRLGFDPDGRVVVRINPPNLAAEPARLVQTYDRMIERLERIPGVTQATYAMYSPMEGDNWSAGISIAGREGRQDEGSSWNRVGPNYFETLGTRIVRGRAFDDRDSPGAARVAIVNQAFLLRFLEGQEPIGQRLGLGGPSHAQDSEIVGVVEDVKYTAAARPTRPMIFFSGLQAVEYAEAGWRSRQNRSMLMRALVLRAPKAGPDLEGQVRRALAEVNPEFSVVRVLPLEEQVGLNFRMNRLMARLTAAYGLLALALATLGVYAVTAFGVSQRTREIGVRMALGADRARVIRTVARGALAQTAVGSLIGAGAAYWAAGLVSSFMYEMEPRDPRVLGAAVLVLLVSALVAAALPARRASRIDPTQALRAE
ncbi:MAG TPA: ADOP family duplicated permease [Vicinamibacterales bacterium]|nr:ADOP family duplicated permease [Vicinamibacterales bacterium]